MPGIEYDLLVRTGSGVPALINTVNHKRFVVLKILRFDRERFAVAKAADDSAF